MTKRPIEKEFLDGLDAHADELAEPLPQELTPLERLKGFVKRYDRSADSVGMSISTLRVSVTILWRTVSNRRRMGFISSVVIIEQL